MQFWDLFQWWNLVFTLPFGIGLLPLLLQAVGVVHLDHGGHIPVGHHPVPQTGGHLLHGPVAAGSHVTPAAATHVHAGTGTHAGHQTQETASHLLSILGIGKVPIMLVFSIFCLIWGAAGTAANLVFSRVLHVPALFVWPSVLCAFLAAYFTTGGLSQWISRFAPELETYGTDEALLVGRTAHAAYELGATPGSAFLLDDQQNRVQVRCRTHDGSSIPRGAEVLLLDYDPQSRIFTVARMQREPVPAGGPPPSGQPVRQQQKMKSQ